MKSAASSSSRKRRGYRIPRVTWYLGRWIRSTDWYPDPQLRLYDRRAGRWNLRQVHESVELVARTRPPAPRAPALRLPRRLSSPGDDRSLHDARRGAVDGRRTAHDRARGRRPPAARVPAELRAARADFSDGAAGLLVSALNSYYVFLKLLKLWELQQQSGPPPYPATIRARARIRTRPPAHPDPEARAAAERRCSPFTSIRRGPGAADRIRCS